MSTKNNQAGTKPGDENTKAATKPAKGADAVEQLHTLLGNLSDQERDTLQRAGVSIPEGDLSAIFTNKHKYGLRCTTCNKLALTFVGTKFKHNGIEYETPPPIRHDMVPWFQDLEPAMIDRHAPKCQNCFHPIPLLRSGAFDVGRQRLVLLADFKGTRDERFDRQAAKKLHREVTTAIAGEATDSMSNSYNQRDTKASSIIDQQHGDGTAAQIDATMEKAGVTAALAKGFK